MAGNNVGVVWEEVEGEEEEGVAEGDGVISDDGDGVSVCDDVCVEAICDDASEDDGETLVEDGSKMVGVMLISVPSAQVSWSQSWTTPDSIKLNRFVWF